SGPAGFGTVGWLTGSVHVFANGLIHFASGGISTIARNSALEVQTSSGVVAIGADTSSTSALPGLARNDGQLTIGHGASVATNTDFSNTGTVEVDYWFFASGGSSFTIGGVLANSGIFRVGFSDTNITAPTTVTATALANTGTIAIGGNLAANSRGTLDIGAAAPATLTGEIDLSGDSLLHFASGGVAHIANGATLNINGGHGFLASGGDTTSNSALTTLADNSGHVILFHGA